LLKTSSIFALPTMTLKHCLGALALLAAPALAQRPAADTLEAGFRNPPDAARPRTWWHWISGNVTKEGITKDLEWMKRVGIGGFQAFDVSLGAGQNVPNKLTFMTPEWLDAVRHTAAEADRLGLEMTMVTSAGWSETGGPWVKPEEAVKKVVWSELRVSGGQKFTGKLPTPPSVNGPIRNLGRTSWSMGGGAAKPDPTLYRDVTVLAYRTPAAEGDMVSQKPTVTTSFGTIEPTALWDDDLTSKVAVPVPSAEKWPWIQYEFAQPFTARAFSMAQAQSGVFGSSEVRAGRVLVSDDGRAFRTLLSFPGPQHDIRALPVRTFAFPATTARFFRIEFVPGGGLSTVGSPPNPTSPTATFGLTEAVFHAGARVHRWEDKANFAPLFNFDGLATPTLPASAVVPAGEVLNLTTNLAADGTLTWDVPPGNWTILRMGYSLTGAKNAPAVPAGVGFEVDKLSRKHLTSYYEQYTAPIKKALGPLYGKALGFWLADSYEADAQNFTDDLLSEFKTRRGYDPTPYLPALAGRVVGSAEVSDRFLWDYRRTLADLLAEQHYGAIADLAHRDGMRVYSEAAGISMPVIQDALLNKSKVDIPMGEFGMGQGLGSGAWKAPADLDAEHAFRGASDRLNAHQADVREAASAAHTYGKPLVAAESWTGGAYEAPADLKLIGDYWNTQGINRFIFHTSTHQPLDTKPGMAMVGSHLHRNISWAEQAGPFLTYLSRNQYLLQQGRFVADVAYFAGESIPSGVPYWERLQPEPPAGYDYDFLSTDLVLYQLTVKNGRVELPSGMSYAVLVLPPTDRMTPKVLRKIRELVAEGATVVGPKPVASPSLSDYPAADAEVTALAAELWGDADGKLVFRHDYGKGRVFSNVPLAGVLAELNIPADLRHSKPHADTYLPWIHRRTADADIFFLVNLRNQTEPVNVSFRVSGKAPELWHPDTGAMEPASYRIENGLTTVPLNLLPQQSVFVVFRKSASTNVWEAPKRETARLTTLRGPWAVRFAPNLGAPETVQFDSLISWTAHPTDGVKFFGGTATYTKTLMADKTWFKPGERLLLDLGDVKDLAEVTLNGKPLGTLWKAPYRVDATGALKPGKNDLVVKVTNQWTNRITGDRSLPAGQKILSGSGFSFGGGGNALKPSGLLGPVAVVRER
jgi:hypothetical protein